MFRDRQEALEELEKQLLSEEEEEEYEEYEDEDYEDEDFDDFEDEEYEDEDLEEEDPEEDAYMAAATRRIPFDFDAYNSDVSDTDLDDYSEEVYGTWRKNGWAFWLLLIAALVLGFAYYLAKKEGLI